MKTVVVGGQARKVGKTSVMAGLIRGLRSLGWTTVKISRHSGGVSHLGPASSRRGATKRRFILTEEKTASRQGDTGRFLAAGARRALWLRVRADSLREAMHALRRALRGERYVMMESNSVPDRLAPSVCLLVLDSSRSEFKATARRLLPRADAIVRVEAPAENRSRSFPIPPGVPVFSVSRIDYFNPRLCRFVRQRVQSSSDRRPKRLQPSGRA